MTEPVERAFGYMAGYGVQLWPILQDMHQLWSTYGERAGTFLSNAGMVQVFNVADIETAGWVSRSIGATTVTYETSGREHLPGAEPVLQHAQHLDHHAPRAPRPHHAGRDHAAGSVTGNPASARLATYVGLEGPLLC